MAVGWRTTCPRIAVSVRVSVEKCSHASTATRANASHDSAPAPQHERLTERSGAREVIDSACAPQ